VTTLPRPFHRSPAYAPRRLTWRSAAPPGLSVSLPGLRTAPPGLELRLLAYAPRLLAYVPRLLAYSLRPRNPVDAPRRRSLESRSLASLEIFL